jgi:hypothetical protein
MKVQDTKDRRKVEAIKKHSLALVREGKAEEVLNWDKESTWHNSKFKNLESGQEWVVYLADHAWPGEVKIIEQ